MQSDGFAVRSAQRMRGVTLIELMVVVAVLAILASIGTASYRRYLIRANRTEAMTTLLQIQVAQEKFFLQNNSYVLDVADITAAPPDGLGVALGAGDTTIPGGHYTITLEDTSATTYTVRATAAGEQDQDAAACHEYTINQAATRTPVTGCWR